MSDLNLLNPDLTLIEVMEIWTKKYAEPHNIEVEKARAILDDANYKWKDAEQKEFAKLKFQRMDTRNIDNARLMNSVTKTVSELADIYDQWEKNIAYNGVQQKEMMQGQADLLQSLFNRIEKLL